MYQEEDVDEHAGIVVGDGEDDHGAADHGIGDRDAGHEGGLCHYNKSIKQF